MSKDVTTPESQDNPQIDNQLKETQQEAVDTSTITEEQKAALLEEFRKTESVKYQKENESLKAWKSKIEADLQKKQEEDLKAKGEWEELKKQQVSRIESLNREKATLNFENKLKSEGMQDSAIALVVKAHSADIELNDYGDATNIDAIVESIKETNADFFGKKPIKQSTAPITASTGDAQKPFSEMEVNDLNGISIDDFAKLRKQSN